MSYDRISYKNDTYDEMADANRREATKIKIGPKPAGQLTNGFTTLDTPKQRLQGHAQTKSERNSVGSRWRPGPGNQHKGKASPSSEESFLKQRKNHESSAK
jgi:hypothetical protein